ncbi:MAG: rRNA cytosine-C5-methylase [Rhodospirillales bacterium]|nr:rRNA cytosine-C5-methylase [Rhodospirillales bacterium]
MTPGARIQAAAELLDEIASGRGAADDVVGNYFRRHRFAGVKDRGAISEHIYGVLRHRAVLDWWLDRLAAVTLPHDGRRRLLTSLTLVEGWSEGDIYRACDGDRFRPAKLDAAEKGYLEGLKGEKLDDPAMPDDVRHNFPSWLGPRLQSLFGKDLPREMAALNGTAPLDLRVNALKGERLDAKLALEGEGIKTESTRYSPLGLRVHERIPLATLDVFKNGLIEVQDEGSQVAALIADARPGMRVVDFCAGAGGKTLALAGNMNNRGHLIACDVSEKRLERATQRLRRAGISIVQRKALSNERDKWIKRHAASFDRVFVDAPCTGTGTWRRNPDAKWRLQEKDLAELAELQAGILASAARLVEPGGRLIYATCSLLREEDEAQIERFLAATPDFQLLPIAQVWRQTIGGKCPCAGDMLRLTPAKHGTDGFFAAVMERVKPEAALPPAEEVISPDLP